MASGAAHATHLDAKVTDSAGSAVSEAVIAFYPTDNSPTSGDTPTPAPTSIDQVHKRFVPHVMAVATGTTISFPNSDNIRHHVYSFSDAKRFELKLYAGRPANPIVMDHPGLIVLGCNIHDWMRAYVFVLDTHWFALTNAAGQAKVDLPAGDYTLKIWHPRHQGGHVPVEHLLHVERDEQSVRETVELDAADDSSGNPPSTPLLTRADGGASQ